MDFVCRRKLGLVGDCLHFAGCRTRPACESLKQNGTRNPRPGLNPCGSRKPVIPPCESEEDYAAELRDYLHHYAPANKPEADLVPQLASAHRRLVRYTRTEASPLGTEMERQRTSPTIEAESSEDAANPTSGRRRRGAFNALGVIRASARDVHFTGGIPAHCPRLPFEPAGAWSIPPVTKQNHLQRAAFFFRRCSLAFMISFMSPTGRISQTLPYFRDGCCATSWTA